MQDTCSSFPLLCMQVLEQQGSFAAAHAAYREALSAADGQGSDGAGLPSAAEGAACRLGAARTAILAGNASLGAELAAAHEDPATWLECARLLESMQRPQACMAVFWRCMEDVLAE